MATAAADLQPAAAPAAASPPPPQTLSSVLLLLRFGTVMAVLLGAAALPMSSLFTVRAVRVEGAAHVSPREIAALVGARPGDRLFAVPAQEIVGRVLRHPRIARAAVSITTAGTIVVRVAERHPAAAFLFQDRYLVLDRTGVVIAEQPRPGALPVVSAAGFTPEWARLGDRLPGGGIERALQALAQLPAGVAGSGTRLRVEPQGDLVLTTADGIAVHLGAPRGLAERAALMREILEAVRARGLALEYLDLRFSGSVVMKPAPPEAGDARGR